MRIFSAAGGTPLHKIVPSDVNGLIPLFPPDGKSYSYLSRVGGASNIWTQPIAGGEPRQITRFKSGTIVQYDWMPDGSLVFNRGEARTDVVLLSGLQ